MNSKDKKSMPFSLKSWSLVSHWVHPSIGLKANFDGIVFTEDGSSRIGIVIRDDKANFIARLSKKIPETLEPDVVEAYATKYAIQLLHDLGFH